MPDVKKDCRPPAAVLFVRFSDYFFSTNLYTQKQAPARAATAAQMQAIFLRVAFIMVPPVFRWLVQITFLHIQYIEIFLRCQSVKAYGLL